MNRRLFAGLVLASAGTCALLSLAGIRLSGVAYADPADAPSDDSAQDADTAEAMVEAGDEGRLVCQVFLTDLRAPSPMDTADATTEIGQWVAERSAEGLVLYEVDFEVGQKPTGYPQGYVQICVYPGP